MKSSKQILALLLSTALLLACFGCQKNGALTARGQADAVPATQGTASRPTEPAPDQPAGSPAAAEDVLRELRTHAADYGLENALSELELKSEIHFDGDTFFRAQAYYHGLPVYGKSVVYVVNAQGEQIAVTGNLTDIQEDINLEPSVSAIQLETSLKQYTSMHIGASRTVFLPDDAASDDHLVICAADAGDPCLAYAYQAAIQGMPYRVLADAKDGKVLFLSPLMDAEEAIGYRPSDAQTQENGFPVQHEDNSFLMEDRNRNIYVRNLNGASIESSDNEVHFDHILSSSVPVSSTDNIFGNTESEKKQGFETAADLYQTVIAIEDAYRNTLGFERAADRLYLFFNDSWGGGKNCGSITLDHASYGKISAGKAAVISVGRDVKELSKATLTHEYGHIISCQVVDWAVNTGENGALNEALSDIICVLLTAKQDGRVEWTIGRRDLTSPGGKPVYDASGTRHKACLYELNGLECPNLAENKEHNSKVPCKIEMSYPEKFNGKNWYDHSDNHINSVLISHAAYLMWNGMDGSANKKISVDQLLSLWYRAMLMMPSDCDFVTCRKMVELAAQSVNLTTEQIACVSEAFEAVGITIKTESSDYIIGPGSTFVVLDASGQPYSSYSYQITGTRSAVSTLENGSYSRTVTVSDSDPQSLTLPEGDYSIRVIDHVDARQTVTFTVDYDIYAPAKEIVVATNFKSPTEADPVSEMYEAYYGLCMERQSEYGAGKQKDNCLLGLSVVRLVDFDGDGTEELYLAWWDQAKQHSGLEIWTYDNGLSRVYETEKFYCASQDTYHEHYLRYTSAGGKTYLWTEDPGLGADRMDWKSELLELKNGVFTPVKTWAFTYLWEGDQVTRYIDGQQVDEETFDDDYYRNMSEHYETTEFLFLLYWEDDSQRITLDETEKTLARLSLKDGEITYTAFPEVPAPYAAFLQSRGYEEYYRDRIQVWDESGSVQARYAVYDVNADGVPELLIYRWESEFGDLMVFTQTASGAVAYAGTLGMFLFPSYSAANNSLVFLSMRPMANGSPMDRDYDYAFVQLQGQDLAGLGHANYNTGKEQWTFIDVGLTVDVDEAEDIPFTDFP